METFHVFGRYILFLITYKYDVISTELSSYFKKDNTLSWKRGIKLDLSAKHIHGGLLTNPMFPYV